jgi:hypothetical protein
MYLQVDGLKIPIGNIPRPSEKLAQQASSTQQCKEKVKSGSEPLHAQWIINGYWTLLESVPENFRCDPESAQLIRGPPRMIPANNN